MTEKVGPAAADGARDASAPAESVLSAAPVSVLDGLLEMIADTERNAAAFAAVRLQLVDTFRSRWEYESGLAPTDGASDIPSRALRAEIAAALSIPEATAHVLMATARTLVHDLPTTLARLGEGRFSERHARILVDGIVGLSPADAAHLERRALSQAELLTAAKFERKVRMLREMISPSDMTERHREAILMREVRVDPAPGGMAYLTAHLPAPEAYAISNYLGEVAKSLVNERETRTHAQLRADVFCDVLLDEGAQFPPGEGEAGLRGPTKRARGITPTAHVTVPVLALAGAENAPASLEGYGPIDPETARRLVGASSGFYRVLTDPETGVMRSFGREKYAVPPELRRYLRQRDGTCRFVGCNRAAKHCDIDHTADWAWLGRTDDDNLAHLCRGHHRLKHASSWAVVQAADHSGRLRWSSPLGRDYTTEPEHATAPDPPPPSPASADQALPSAVAQKKWHDPNAPAPF